MGQSSSAPAIVSGLSRNQNQELYKLVDHMGGGELIPWTKHGIRTGDWSILEGYIELKVCKFLLNDGQGKPVPISDLVKKRNEERNAMLGALRRKKGKGKSGPNILDQMDQDQMQGGDMMKALKFLDGGKGGKGGGKYREICWDVDKRGGMGETIIHVCLLQGSNAHNTLAKRILNEYPKLVNDIFISEDYYGQSPLHQAVVNEDAKMVRFLISHGANTNERTYGAFFCPDDQRGNRTDSMEHEAVDVPVKTNYQSRTYWGETPLAFAACTQQEDLYRILRANKGDPNMRDTNENTVLHMMVIRELPYMFDVVYKTGGKLHASNRQNLTPLNLAAKLAKAEMFQHILTIEREILWEYGKVVCAAYPLNFIDTIDITNGEINDNSALAHIVFGDSDEHLNLLPGLMDDLLREKWNAFGRTEFAGTFLFRFFFEKDRQKWIHIFLFRFIKQLLWFIIYWTCVFTAYYLRNYGNKSLINENSAQQHMKMRFDNTTDMLKNDLVDTVEGLFAATADNTTIVFGNETSSDNMAQFGWFSAEECFLLHTERCPKKDQLFDACYVSTMVRFVCEGMTVLLAVKQLIENALLIRRVTWKKYIRTMANFQANLIFTISLFVVLAMVPMRFICAAYAEHVLATIVVIATTVRFLFFCRGIKFIGPFVLMLYKIITVDIVRFFLIYLIFVIGFSQAFFIIFNSCYRGRPAEAAQYTNIIEQPFEAFMRCFIMSIGEFAEFYHQMNMCRLRDAGKVLFIIFELLVSVMLVNLLIAMMARTYELIAATANEWKRQWANVILMLEQQLTPRERMLAVLKYSRPLTTDKRKRAFVVMWNRSEEEVKERAEERAAQLTEYRDRKRQMLRRRMYPETDSGRASRATSSVMTDAKRSIVQVAVQGFADNAAVGDMYD